MKYIKLFEEQSWHWKLIPKIEISAKICELFKEIVSGNFDKKISIRDKKLEAITGIIDKIYYRNDFSHEWQKMCINKKNESEILIRRLYDNLTLMQLAVLFEYLQKRYPEAYEAYLVKKFANKYNL